MIKMKRLVIILFILFALPIPVYAWDYINVPVITSDAAACSSPETFRYHMENSNDVTVGTPTGCSNGDTTGTENGITYESASPAPQDGTYSLLCDGVNDKIEFDVISRDIVTEVQGNKHFWFYLDTYTSARDIVHVASSGNDFIQFQLLTNTDNELRLRYRGNGTTVALSTTACDLTTGVWVEITIRWQQTGDPNLFIDCGGSTISTNTDLTAWAGNPSIFRIGDSGNFALQGNVDALTIKETYAD